MAGEGYGQIVDANFNGGFEVFLVFLSQRRSRKTTALLIDAFMVGELTADHHGGMYLLAVNTGHIQHQTSVI